MARVKGLTVAYVADPGKLRETCVKADIVVARFAKSKACLQARMVIDLTDIRHYGTHLVTIAGADLALDTIGAFRGARPWTGAGRPVLQRSEERLQAAGQNTSATGSTREGGADPW